MSASFISSDAPDSTLACARTLLFVPGNRPERFEKALASGADAIVLDLEDSVPAAAKSAARDSVAAAWPTLRGGRVPVVVRVNSVASDAGQADLAWLRQQLAFDGVMLSKAESVEEIGTLGSACRNAPILPLVETAAGLLRLAELARSPGVLRLAVGHIDFMADTGIVCSEGEHELDPLRFAVALHTRVARLAPALDGVTVAIDDAALLEADTRRALRFGFGGKLCIHPRQTAIVHAAMRPTNEELAWAQRVVDADGASGGAAVQLDGRMVDLPVVLRAQRILARAVSAESALS